MTNRHRYIEVDWPLLLFVRGFWSTCSILCPGRYDGKVMMSVCVTMLEAYSWIAQQLFSSTVLKGYWGSSPVDILHLKRVIHLEGTCFPESTLSGLPWLSSHSRWRTVHPVVVNLHPPAGPASSTHWAQEWASCRESLSFTRMSSSHGVHLSGPSTHFVCEPCLQCIENNNIY